METREGNDFTLLPFARIRVLNSIVFQTEARHSGTRKAKKNVSWNFNATISVTLHLKTTPKLA
jgi:hypothetical protein